MTETEQIDRFNDELDRLIARFVSEHDVSYAAMIGALHLKIYHLCEDSCEPEGEGA